MTAGRVLLALVSGTLVVLFVIAGIAASLFFLEINPLAGDLTSRFFGRTEALSLYVIARTLYSFTPLFDSKREAVVVLMAAVSFLTLAFHLYEQPFHAPLINTIRAGMHGFLAGMSCACGLAVGDVEHARYVLMALPALLALIAMVVCKIRQTRITNVAYALRASATMYKEPKRKKSKAKETKKEEIPDETPRSTVTASDDQVSKPEARSPGGRFGFASGRGSPNSPRTPGFVLPTPTLITESLRPCQPTVPNHGISTNILETTGIKGIDATRPDQLFNSKQNETDRDAPRWWGDMDAVLACRVLLFQRDEELLPVIKHTLVTTLEQRAITLYTSLWLASLSLFILKDSNLTQKILDAVDKNPIGIMFDATFLRFALRQKMVQASDTSMIGMMEVTKEQEVAEEFHREAVRNLRLIWRDMSTSLDHAMLPSRLEAFSNACNRASAAFNELAIKFPSSPALLRAHAQFIEDVMSDTSRAKDMRIRADHLEDMTAMDEDDPVKQGGGASETQSVGTRSQGSQGSRSETGGGAYRIQTTWGQTVLSREAASLRTAAKSVQNAILAMVCDLCHVSSDMWQIIFLTTGLLVVDIVLQLLTQSTEHSLEGIRSINDLRMDVVNVVFSTRPFVVAAAESLITNNNTNVLLAGVAGQAAAMKLAEGLGTFYTESDPVVLDAMTSSIRMRDPRPHGWWVYDDTGVLAAVQGAAQALASAVEMPYELAGKPTSWEESENLLLRRLMTLTWVSLAT